VQRWRRRLRALPRPLRIVSLVVAVTVLWLSANWLYQVARKPAELLFPLSDGAAKQPAETWRHYESIFRAHETPVITAHFLAALAQVEAAGNPIARTYWRWRFTLNPFGIYRPASSAVGMYQMTDSTFRAMKRFCIHDHAVVQDGPWHDFESCWFNALYTRVIPTHAVELTSAYLDHRVTTTLARARVTHASLQQKQDLAAVEHLCGAGTAGVYAARSFRTRPGQRCGDHLLQSYLDRLTKMKAQFAKIDAQR
jgi:hypothetical protein